MHTRTLYETPMRLIILALDTMWSGIEKGLTKLSDLLWGPPSIETPEKFIRVDPTRTAIDAFVELNLDEWEPSENVLNEGIKAYVKAHPANIVHAMPTGKDEKLAFEEWCLDGNDERIREVFNFDIEQEYLIRIALRTQYQHYLGL
jgi:hypothetical protein